MNEENYYECSEYDNLEPWQKIAWTIIASGTFLLFVILITQLKG